MVSGYMSVSIHKTIRFQLLAFLKSNTDDGMLTSAIQNKEEKQICLGNSLSHT